MNIPLFDQNLPESCLTMHKKTSTLPEYVAAPLSDVKPSWSYALHVATGI